ncbi:MAG: DUF3024 domain-containing protein [Bdellovibrionales bacterium]|nr:DUF3024 domain-containing protein [Bdellovibrionales bacterium]
MTKSGSNWHHYQSLPANADFDPLVAEVDRDPTGIFLG